MTKKNLDIIIVGGGSAGSVLAARLSENNERQVLLLEAGHAPASDQYPQFLASSDILGANLDPEYEWGYKTEAGFIKNPIAAIRGKVLGGSSAVNGAVAIRARVEDFKRWNLEGWSYEDLLPAFKKLEHRHSKNLNPALHGIEGPFPVVQFEYADVTPLQKAFIDSSIKVGLKQVDDFDGEDPNGVGPYPMNIVDGVRVNTAMAYLTDHVRTRENLEIRGDQLVDRVLFEGKKAVGVRLANGDEIFAKEIILSAGTYGSAAILLRSGIGPKADLEKLGISSIADLPVGQNLIDHPFYYNAYAAIPEKVGAQSPVIGAKVWTKSSTTKNNELDLHITATHLFPHEYSPTKVGFVLAVALTRPISHGRIWIESKDPHAAPKIDLNFLAEEYDRTRIIEGIRLARKIAQVEPLSQLLHSELAPASDDEVDIIDSIRNTIDTYHHPVASAPMGQAGDTKSVVDLRAQVLGVEGLKVVDASIFPDIPSVATNVTTIAVAEHFSSFYR